MVTFVNAQLAVEMAKPDAPSFDTSALKDEDSKRDDCFEFETRHKLYNGKVRFEARSSFLTYKPFSDLCTRQLVFFLERKTGMCGSMRVSHDEIAGTGQIENVEIFTDDNGCPLVSTVTFPLACYGKLCKAIVDSYKFSRRYAINKADFRANNSLSHQVKAWNDVLCWCSKGCPHPVKRTATLVFPNNKATVQR